MHAVAFAEVSDFYFVYFLDIYSLNSMFSYASNLMLVGLDLFTGINLNLV